MLVKGKSKNYDVRWSPSGWSYAVPVVYERKTFIGISYRKKLWEGPSRGIIEARKMGRVSVEHWLQSAVAEYEEYIESWR